MFLPIGASRVWGKADAVVLPRYLSEWWRRGCQPSASYWQFDKLRRGLTRRQQIRRPGQFRKPFIDTMQYYTIRRGNTKTNINYSFTFPPFSNILFIVARFAYLSLSQHTTVQPNADNWMANSFPTPRPVPVIYRLKIYAITHQHITKDW